MTADLRLLHAIADVLKEHPPEGVTHMSVDGDNRDGELLLTFEGKTHILRSRDLEIVDDDEDDSDASAGDDDRR